MAIKDEVGGSSGYLKKVRDHYLPSSKEMADLAFDRYQSNLGIEITKDYVLTHTDEILKGLFIAETEIFAERNNSILSSALPYYVREIYKRTDERYPETSASLERLEQLLNDCQNQRIEMEYFISEISETLVPIMDVVSFSQKQSAKCRVGNTLQNHLQTIFEKCDIPNSPQQQRENGGTIMDFVIPSLEAYNTMPDQVINIECQTTLKDRFRLTTGKSTDARIKRYLATATGCGLVTQRDINDITIEKVKEIIVSNNVTLVVFEDVKNNIITKIQTAYQKAVDEDPTSAIANDLQNLLRLSGNKIVTYKELVNRDIRSILVYWDNA
ncbi:MAG: type II restriction endonuclease [Clostridiales bacterium]|nr:type II restriction endonuclease [Clostridiales bacterium]